MNALVRCLACGALGISVTSMAGCRTSKPSPLASHVYRVPRFATSYPEALGETARFETAVESRQPLVYGRMIDPLGNAVRITALYPLIEQSVEEINQRQQPKLSTALYAGLLFLEGGGQQFIIAASHRETFRAAGVAQLIPDTARHYGLRVDTLKSVSLRRKRKLLIQQIDQKRNRLAKTSGKRHVTIAHNIMVETEALRRVEVRLITVDERFNVRKSIGVGARYLRDHLDDFGREDWAIQSYHAGSGNMQRILRLYATGKIRWQGSVKATILSSRLSWSRLLYDVSPSRHPQTFAFLWHSLNDQSRDYYWRVVAAAKAVELYRQSPQAFRAKVMFYQAAKKAGRGWPLAREMEWYPPASAEITQWQTWQDLKSAYESGTLVLLPDRDKDFTRVFALEVDNIGDYAGADVPKWVYRLLRPEAAGVLYYLGSRVRAESGNPRASITVASMARSAAYQQKIQSVGQSPARYSCHRAGVSFDLLIPKDSAIKNGLEYLLWDLRYRGAITWMFEGERSGRNRHYHITVAPDGHGQAFKLVWTRATRHFERVVRDRSQARLTAQEPDPSSTWLWQKWLLVVWVVGIIAFWVMLGSPANSRRRRVILALLWPILLIAIVVMLATQRRRQQ